MDIINSLNQFAAWLQTTVPNLTTDTAWIVVWILLALPVIIHLIVALIVGGIAKEKGYSRLRGFNYVFWLGLFGYIALAALPDRKLQRLHEEEIRRLAEVQKALSERDPYSMLHERTFADISDSISSFKMPEI